MRRVAGIAAVVVALALAVPLVLLAGGGSDDPGQGETSSSTTPARSVTWQTVPLQGRPAGLAALGDRVLVVDDEGGLVQAIDAASRSVVGSTAVGGALVGVDVGEVASGTWVIDALGGVAWLPVVGDLVRFDVGGAPTDVVASDDVAYVADIESGQVVALTADRGVLRRFDVPDGVVRLAADGARLWVTGRDHTVTPIDLAAGVVGPPVEVGLGPIGVAVADGTVWVANGDDATVSRLDAATGARRGPDIPVGSGPTAIAVHGDDVWVLAHDAATVTHLDARTGQRAEPDLPVPAALSRPRDLVVTDAGVWVTGVDASLLAFLPTG